MTFGDDKPGYWRLIHFKDGKYECKDDFDRRFLYELGRRSPGTEIQWRLVVIGMSVVVVLLVITLLSGLL